MYTRRCLRRVQYSEGGDNYGESMVGTAYILAANNSVICAGCYFVIPRCTQTHIPSTRNASSLLSLTPRNAILTRSCLDSEGEFVPDSTSQTQLCSYQFLVYWRHFISQGLWRTVRKWCQCTSRRVGVLGQFNSVFMCMYYAQNSYAHLASHPLPFKCNIRPRSDKAEQLITQY
jgi:hypothetical protein